MRRSADNGFTLFEVLIVVVMLGVLALMAVPRLERGMVRRDLAGARAGMSAFVLRAKATAVQRRRPVTLTVETDRASLSVPTAGGGTQLVGVLNLNADYGVQLTSSAATLVFQPTGLVASGTPFTVWVAKAGHSDSIRVTGFGRVE